jgi:hypothetical protein
MTLAAAPRRVLGALAAAPLLLLACSVPAEAQERTPIVSVDRTSVAAGEVLRVSDVNWPPNATLSLEICGNMAAAGSIDCDRSATTSVIVNGSGFFAANVTVNRPPSPCPCVVQAWSLSTSDEATTSIAIAGVPELPGAPVGTVLPVASFLTVDDATLNGSGPWTSWFGLSPRRTLEFTLHNAAEFSIDPPALVLTAGHSDEPTGYVPSVDPEPLEPGESRTITVPIEFDPVSFGGLVVRGEIQGLATPVVFRASTRSDPWGLIALAIVAVLLVLVLIRNAVRRRLRARDARETEIAALGNPRSIEAATSAATDIHEKQPVVAARPAATNAVDVVEERVGPGVERSPTS